MTGSEVFGALPIKDQVLNMEIVLQWAWFTLLFSVASAFWTISSIFVVIIALRRVLVLQGTTMWAITLESVQTLQSKDRTSLEDNRSIFLVPTRNVNGGRSCTSTMVRKMYTSNPARVEYSPCKVLSTPVPLRCVPYLPTSRACITVLQLQMLSVVTEL